MNISGKFIFEASVFLKINLIREMFPFRRNKLNKSVASRIIIKTLTDVSQIAILPLATCTRVIFFHSVMMRKNKFNTSVTAKYTRSKYMFIYIFNISFPSHFYYIYFYIFECY